MQWIQLGMQICKGSVAKESLNVRQLTVEGFPAPFFSLGLEGVEHSCSNQQISKSAHNQGQSPDVLLLHRLGRILAPAAAPWPQRWLRRLPRRPLAARPRPRSLRPPPRAAADALGGDALGGDARSGDSPAAAPHLQQSPTPADANAAIAPASAYVARDDARHDHSSHHDMRLQHTFTTIVGKCKERCWHTVSRWIQDSGSFFTTQRFWSFSLCRSSNNPKQFAGPIIPLGEES